MESLREANYWLLRPTYPTLKCRENAHFQPTASYQTIPPTPHPSTPHTCYLSRHTSPQSTQSSSRCFRITPYIPCAALLHAQSPHLPSRCPFPQPPSPAVPQATRILAAVAVGAPRARPPPEARLGASVKVWLNGSRGWDEPSTRG